jgi:hypothetical protein
MGYRPIAKIGVHTCGNQYYRPWKRRDVSVSIVQ